MGRCESCNRSLRDPRSVELGFGPGCWARLDPAVRATVLARTQAAADGTGVGAPAPESRVATATSAGVPYPPRRSDSALAVLGSWAVGLVLVLGLVVLWRWLLLGLAVVAVVAVTGLLIEHVQERRPTRETTPSTARPRRRERRPVSVAPGSHTVHASSALPGSRPVPTTSGTTA